MALAYAYAYAQGEQANLQLLAKHLVCFKHLLCKADHSTAASCKILCPASFNVSLIQSISCAAITALHQVLQPKLKNGMHICTPLKHHRKPRSAACQVVIYSGKSVIIDARHFQTDQ